MITDEQFFNYILKFFIKNILFNVWKRVTVTLLKFNSSFTDEIFNRHPLFSIFIRTEGENYYQNTKLSYCFNMQQHRQNRQNNF